MEGIINLAAFLGLLSVGYFIGSYTEKMHYKSIIAREKSFLGLPAVTIKNGHDISRTVLHSQLAQGSVVISIDYFKRFLAALRNLFGGNVVSYETLIDRGRREALLRMKEDAGSADIIINTRLETSVIGASANRKNSLGSIEVLAYGTAVKYAE